MAEVFELLKRKNTSEVLKYFLEHPTGKAYAQQLGKEIRLSRISILGGLHALLEAGALEVEEIGRIKRYHLKRNEPAVKQLKIILTINKVMPLVKELKGSGVEAYLFGSSARGEDTETSDIDLMLIGSIPQREAIGKIGKMEKLKPIYFTFMDYSTLARKDKAFYERVEKDRIRLV